METKPMSPMSFESMPWALLLIWWGIFELAPPLPRGTGALGVALILLGVNALRRISGSPVCRFSMTIGAVALVAGALSLARSVLHLSLDIPTMPILLIATGGVLLFWEAIGLRAEGRSPGDAGVTHAKTS